MSVVVPFLLLLLAGGFAAYHRMRLAYWAAMTAEQRAEHGLPETGWGRALFGDARGDDPRDGPNAEPRRHWHLGRGRLT